jgi:phosphoribosylformylglycinamidine synthase
MKPEWLWYEDQFNPSDYSSFIVPGGFSYGDYLRCGALAAKAPVMKSLHEAASKGMPILGICNGFQILCETRLLPGALVRNEKRKFIDKWVVLNQKSKTKWSGPGSEKPMRLPIAHGEGRFYVEDDEAKKLFDKNQVWLTYEGGSPQGAVWDIAGVANEAGNVCALMPHPERAMFDWMGGEDGRAILGAAVRA